MKDLVKASTLIQLSITLLSATLMTACGGGGGGGGSSAAPLTAAQHDALAQAFIQSATAEGLGYTMVKQDTQQTGYIIVKESNGTYAAFDVDRWTQSSGAASLQADYTMLAPAGNNTYQTYISDGYENYVYVSSGYYSTDANGNQYWVDTSGNVDEGWVDTSYYLTFEVAQPTTKDLQKLAAFKQTYEVNASAQKVQQKYGLSLERATQVAKLAIQVKNTPKMSGDDYDSLSQQLLGVPVAKLDSAMAKTVNGDSSATSDVNDIIDQAAKTNGVGPEQARSLLNSITSPASAAVASSK